MTSTPTAPSKPFVMSAQPEDWERYKAVRLAALMQDPEAFAATLDGEQDQADAFWQDRITSAKATLIASIDDIDLGCLVLIPSWDRDEDLALVAFWVSPQGRGRGVGQALLKAAVAVAKTTEAQRLVLEVGDENEAAIRVYEKMGFLPTGVRNTLPPPQEHISEHERALELNTTRR